MKRLFPLFLSLLTGYSALAQLNPLAIGDIPASKTLVISYQITINNPISATQISNQGVISGTNFSSTSTNTTNTALIPFPDLSPNLLLPQSNFGVAPNNVRDFVVNIFEAVGQPTPPGSVSMTITAPTGYTLSFNTALTSINVTDGTTNPVAVENSRWSVMTQLAGQQLSLVINSGQSIAAGGTAKLGFTITRTSANSGSVSNITVNVTDDPLPSYDGNSSNNVYARIISGL
ncbi:hypothetical protein [Spirosoma gilvum]